MQSLDQTKALILVFGLPDCPACEEYVPRLTRQIEGFIAYGQPFVLYDNKQPLKPGQIPVIILDAGVDDPNVQALADQHQVEGLPTTVLMTQKHGHYKELGALDDQQIYKLLTTASYYNNL